MLSDSSDDARFVTRTMTKGATTRRWERDERFPAHARAMLTFVSMRTHENRASDDTSEWPGRAPILKNYFQYLTNTTKLPPPRWGRG